MPYRPLLALLLIAATGTAHAGGTIQSGTTYLQFTGTPFSGTAGTMASDLVNADGAVAYQWTQSLAPGQGMDLRSSFAVNLPVPEPGTPLLLTGGLLALATWRRRAAR